MKLAFSPNTHVNSSNFASGIWRTSHLLNIVEFALNLKKDETTRSYQDPVEISATLLIPAYSAAARCIHRTNLTSALNSLQKLDNLKYILTNT
jgi:hypothetical protein